MIIEEIMEITPVIPVIVVDEVDHASADGERDGHRPWPPRSALLLDRARPGNRFFSSKTIAAAIMRAGTGATALGHAATCGAVGA